MIRRQCHELLAPSVEERTVADEQCVRSPLRDRRKSSIDIAVGGGRKHFQTQSECERRCLQVSRIRISVAISGVD
jgi:hypothetical protein